LNIYFRRVHLTGLRLDDFNTALRKLRQFLGAPSAKQEAKGVGAYSADIVLWTKQSLELIRYPATNLSSSAITDKVSQALPVDNSSGNYRDFSGTRLVAVLIAALTKLSEGIFQ